MSLIIEDNFVDIQTKTTHALVDQRIILSEQEHVDSILDKISYAKSTHSKLIPEYRLLIENVVTFLESSQSVAHLIAVAESINNLVATTKRLMKSFGDGKLKECFISEIKEYKILLSDINEISGDIQLKLAEDKEMADLLNAL